MELDNHIGTIFVDDEAGESVVFAVDDPVRVCSFLVEVHPAESESILDPPFEKQVVDGLFFVKTPEPYGDLGIRTEISGTEESASFIDETDRFTRRETIGQTLEGMRKDPGMPADDRPCPLLSDRECYHRLLVSLICLAK